MMSVWWLRSLFLTYRNRGWAPAGSRVARSAVEAGGRVKERLSRCGCGVWSLCRAPGRSAPGRGRVRRGNRSARPPRAALQQASRLARLPPAVRRTNALTALSTMGPDPRSGSAQPPGCALARPRTCEFRVGHTSAKISQAFVEEHALVRRKALLDARPRKVSVLWKDGDAQRHGDPNNAKRGAHVNDSGDAPRQASW